MASSFWAADACIFKRFFVISIFPIHLHSSKADVAHLVEHDLAKVGVAGSSPVIRSQ
jgi:hypothetical protein